MDNKIVAEMLTHIGCCTHNKIQNVLVIASNSFIDTELEKYKNIKITKVDTLSSEYENQFDLIVSDEINIDTTNIYRSLTSDGLYCGMSENVCNTESIKKIYTSYGKLFTIVMPYVAMIDSMQSIATFVLLSKKFHPTADIHLDKSDFLEDLHYYHSDIHKSAFEMPTFIKQDLLKIIKR